MTLHYARNWREQEWAVVSCGIIKYLLVILTMSSAEEPISDVENDLEIIQEGEVENIQNQEENVEETNENEENAETETKTVVKPKRVIKNPQPKLNEETLKGPKGLTAIESYFERVKFKGRGYEEQDLNVLMKTYEYWCHRLFPKFPFDDCIARLEKLGTKKATQTHIKRIRLDINFDDDKPLLSDEGENDTGGFVDTYNDQFDQLLPATSHEPVLEMTEEQLERMRQNKERAQRLREERLRKMREMAQNNLGEPSQMITQSSQEINATENSLEGSSQDNIYERPSTYENGNELESNHETTEDSTNVNGTYSQNESDKRTNLNNSEKEKQLQGSSDDGMDSLELHEKNTTKKKKRVIESDSEDEIMDDTNKEKTDENSTRHNLEAADDKLINPNENRLLTEDNDVEMADTLELEVGNTTKKKKRVIESDGEDEIISDADKDKTVKENMNHNLESADDDEELGDRLIIDASGNNDADDGSILNGNGVVNTQNNSNGYICSQNKGQIINNENESKENDIEDMLNEINTDGDYPIKFDSAQNATIKETSYCEVNKPDTMTETT